jgi:RNA polymerase sigma-70 factor (sigma-E family)
VTESGPATGAEAGPAGPGLDGRDPREAEVAAVFHAHRQYFVRLAWLMTSDAARAEELVQEAFVKAWRNWGRLRSQQAAVAYVRAAVVNQARMSLRRRLVEQRHQAAGLLDAFQPAVGRDLDLERTLGSLPPRRRACVVLRYYADLTEREMADTLGISVGTVKSQTSRALRQLQQALGGEFR